MSTDKPTERLLARAEVPAEHCWDLSVFYDGIETWEATFAEAEAAIVELAEHRGKMNQGVEAIGAFLEARYALRLRVLEVFFYAMLRCDEDTTNGEAAALRQRALGLRHRFDEAASFFNPELLALPQHTLDEHLESEALAPYRFQLECVIRLKPHTLSEPEEQLLAQAQGALQGPYNIFAQVNSSDVSFGEIEGEGGEQIELSASRYASLLTSPDRALRERAFRAFYGGYSAHRHGLAAMLASSVKVSTFEAKVRHFESARAAALFDSHVPEAVYDNLVGAINDRLGALHRYNALRAKVLGVDALQLWDLYVPLVPEAEAHHTYEDAVSLILGSLEPLGAEYQAALGHGLREGRWVDRYENRGKRPGAYSAGCHGKPPRILMNYRPDNIREVFTLAHEAGHAMHSWFSHRAQPSWDSRYSIFVAEVASTFNEALLVEYLLERTSDPRRRAYLISYELGAIASTVYRQTMFAEFEHRLHARDEAHESLSLDDITGLYREHLERYHGEHVVLDPVIDIECLRVPHFYFGFYVYQYATGLSAALALSQRVLREGAGAREDYLRFLSAGGSCPPLDALRSAGVDMTERAPIEATLNHFERRLEALEALVADGVVSGAAS